MKEEEVLSIFENIDGHLLLEKYEDGSIQSIFIVDFMQRFNGAECNYESLSNHENAIGYWQEIFKRIFDVI